MEMTRIEKLFIRSAFRVYFLRKFEAPKVLSDLNIGKDSVCLEFGCGRGAGSLLINKYLDCNRIVGVDIDPGMIEAAKRYVSRPPGWARNIRTDNIEFSCQDAANLSFPDGYFDAVFIFTVLEHIKEWRKVVAEVSRVLKTGGILSFEEFLLGKSLTLLRHVPIGEAELINALENSGFSILSFEKAKYLPRYFARAVKSSSAK